MSREIKFRAWDKCLKVMFPVADINFISFAVYSANPNIKHIGNIGEHCTTLMQFTGLFDKNGKEIYEGDIVKVDIPDPIHKIFYETFIVIWQQDKMRFGLQELNKKDYSDSWAFTPKNDFEVISNIYSNPELLKESES